MTYKIIGITLIVILSFFACIGVIKLLGSNTPDILLLGECECEVSTCYGSWINSETGFGYSGLRINQLDIPANPKTGEACWK